MYIEGNTEVFEDKYSIVQEIVNITSKYILLRKILRKARKEEFYRSITTGLHI